MRYLDAGRPSEDHEPLDRRGPERPGVLEPGLVAGRTPARFSLDRRHRRRPTLDLGAKGRGTQSDRGPRPAAAVLRSADRLARRRYAARPQLAEGILEGGQPSPVGLSEPVRTGAMAASA